MDFPQSSLADASYTQTAYYHLHIRQMHPISPQAADFSSKSDLCSAVKEAAADLFTFTENSEKARTTFESFLNTIKSKYDLIMADINGDISLINPDEMVSVGDQFTGIVDDISNLKAAINEGKMSTSEWSAVILDLES